MSTTTLDDAAAHLQAVGFGEYEAKAYATLVRDGPLTGYQLAKNSGIPRPNIYGIIDRLEKRSAVTRIEVRDGVKYAALPAEDMLARLSKAVQTHLADAGEALDAVARAQDAPYVWNLDGYDNIIARAEALVGDAREDLLVATWSNESALLDGALAAATARGVRITVLCVQGCAGECGHCRGDIHRYPVASDVNRRWLMLAADSSEALIAEVASGEARGAQTALPVVVGMTQQYIRNTIAAAEIVRSVGARLPKLLDGDARRAVDGAGLAAGGQSWLQRLSAVVRKGRPA
jgi:hypothetical protein